ncbi:MAG: nitroreductase family protein [Bacteroidales bacterium]|nr:nitroreductase family protein [Bacteroidales bacterium]
MNRRQIIKRSSSMIAGVLVSGNLLAGCKSNKLNNQEEMSVWDIFENRRSVRHFKPDPVPEEHLKKIINAARFAPTSGNQQPWKFIVVQDAGKIQELKETYLARNMERIKNAATENSKINLEERQQKLNQYAEKFFSAPAYIVVLTDNESRYSGYNKHDGPLAAGYLMLAARALGYGTVYATDSVSEEITREVFNIPERYTRICFTPLGVPAEWPDTPPKKDLEEFIINDTF